MGLEDVAGRLASTYSGGMIRRLELAQALVNRPALLILDEPTIGLDPLARRTVWARIERLRRETETTLLLTTHYMEEADALCDRVAMMHRGRIRALGPGASLEDVFADVTGDGIEEGGSIRDVRVSRRTIGRVG